MDETVCYLSAIVTDRSSVSCWRVVAFLAWLLPARIELHLAS